MTVNHKPETMAVNHRSETMAVNHQSEPMVDTHQSEVAVNHQPEAMAVNIQSEMAVKHKSEVAVNQTENMAVNYQSEPLVVNYQSEMALNHQPETMSVNNQSETMAVNHQTEKMNVKKHSEPMVVNHRSEMFVNCQTEAKAVNIQSEMAVKHKFEMAVNHQTENIVVNHQSEIMTVNHQSETMAVNNQSDSTESHQSLDSDEDIVELAPLAQHVNHEIFDVYHDTENIDLDQLKESKGSGQNTKTNTKRSNNREKGKTIKFKKSNDYIRKFLKVSKCDFCQKLFKDAFSVKVHMKSHGFCKDSQISHHDVQGHGENRPKLGDKVKENNIVVCDICKEQCPTEIVLMVHKQDNHGVCSVCNITLPSCDTLQQHLDTHSVANLQRCLICGSGFLARVALLHHIKNEHADPCHHQAVYDTIYECDKQSPNPGLNEFLFRCPYCRRMFPLKQDCLEHMKTHNSELKCKLCHEEFEDRSCLLKHTFKHSKTGRVRCDVCMSDVSGISVGYHSECDKRILCCRRCGHLHVNTLDLAQHMINHVNVVIYKCDICHKKYICFSSLKKHKRIHEEPKFLECKFCSLTFNDREKLRKHFKESHENVDKTDKHVCLICHKTFYDKRLLTKHMIYHRPKTLKCHFCPMMYKSKMHLKYHESTHTGEKKYACDICKKTFTQPSALKTHKLVHSGIRAFKCSECDKSFKTQSQLKYHMFTHTGQRPYVCDICGKGFTNETHKKTHMRTHTGETPYLCQHCGAAYPTNGQLQRHVLTHQ